MVTELEPHVFRLLARSPRLLVRAFYGSIVLSVVGWSSQSDCVNDCAVLSLWFCRASLHCCRTSYQRARHRRRDC